MCLSQHAQSDRIDRRYKALLFCKGVLLSPFMFVGPCGGKSTCAAEIVKLSVRQGYKSITIPEASTLLVLNGGHYPGSAPDKRAILLSYEKILFQLQLQLEETFMQLALHHESQGEKVLVVCDRGLLDIKAYAPDDIWPSLLSHFNLTEEAMASRYGLIVHLVTAADGAETFYTTSNNAARRETVEEARELDKKTFDCWSFHSNHKRIANHRVADAFSVKLEETVAIVSEYLVSF